MKERENEKNNDVLSVCTTKCSRWNTKPFFALLMLSIARLLRGSNGSHFHDLSTLISILKTRIFDPNTDPLSLSQKTSRDGTRRFLKFIQPLLALSRLQQGYYTIVSGNYLTVCAFCKMYNNLDFAEVAFILDWCPWTDKRSKWKSWQGSGT